MVSVLMFPSFIISRRYSCTNELMVIFYKSLFTIFRMNFQCISYFHMVKINFVSMNTFLVKFEIKGDVCHLWFLTASANYVTIRRSQYSVTKSYAIFFYKIKVLKGNKIFSSVKHCRTDEMIE